MKTYYKLVRDKIPELIEKSGTKPVVKKIKKENFKYYLKIKLKEEVDEVLKTESVDDLKERIADIKQVIDYMLKEYDISRKDISKAQKIKNTKKGKYDKRKLLIVTEKYD